MLFTSENVCAQTSSNIEYVKGFENKNHPQIAYWFLTPAIVDTDSYLSYMDNMLDHSYFDFIFLDAREGSSFDNVEKMHPVLEKIVAHAHERHIRIGIRMHPKALKKVPEEITERFIAEGETKLNHAGTGICSMNSSFVRTRTSLKKEPFKVYLFKKTMDGFYDPKTLKETSDYDYSIKDETVTITIKAGNQYAGYTAYAMSEFYYKSISNHSSQVVAQTIQFIDQYATIPLDGIMLDEYGNQGLKPAWLVKFKAGGLRLRSYSLPLSKELVARTGDSSAITLFNMRYAPDQHPEIRIKAINVYMDLLREGAMHVENAMYKRAKKVFGVNCFIGAHNTFHNSLIHDDIWATGIKWWSIPREYGFTDEKTPLPTQLGIAMSYPNNAMYNMYYDGNIQRFVTKTFGDLHYGIRTFYHAFNDTHWGIGLEQPQAYTAINPVENAARLMNQFNPSLPEVKLLVVFGNEALQNWYPNKQDRGKYDINDQLNIEEKTLQILKAGYLNALVPTDLINEGKLILNKDHKATLNGHVFDAVIFLYPQYAKEPVIKFLEDYVNHAGKLMLVGDAAYDFNGTDITDRMNLIRSKSVLNSFSVSAISDLGIEKNVIKNGAKNQDGSYVFTNLKSIQRNKSTSFSIVNKNNKYTGSYKGLAAIQFDEDGNLKKLAATAFTDLKLNGKEILHLSKEADILINKTNKEFKIIIADSTHSIKLTQYAK
jgi:hypothetical protein